MNFSYDVHVLLAKSEKFVGRRRWLSSYDKSILRTLAIYPRDGYRLCGLIK